MIVLMSLTVYNLYFDYYVTSLFNHPALDNSAISLRLEQFGSSTSTSAIVQDLNANLLDPGSYSGPQIPCYHDNANKNNQYNTTYEVANVENITAIFFMSARYCHPDLRLFKAVWESHKHYMLGFERMRKVYLFDGFGDVGM